MIGLDPTGRIREVRFNNRSMRPLRLPHAEIVAFYAAYRRFAEIAEPTRADGHLPARPRRLPGLRQHPAAARPHRFRRHRRPPPAGLLRRPGRDSPARWPCCTGRTRRHRRSARAVRGPGRGRLPGRGGDEAEHMLQAAALAEAAGAHRSWWSPRCCTTSATSPGADRGRPDGRHRQPAQPRRRGLARPLVRPGGHRADPAARRRQALPVRRRPGYCGLLSAASAYTLERAGRPDDAGRSPRSRPSRTPPTRWPCAAGTTRPRTPTRTVPPFEHYRDRIALLARP